MPRAGVNEKSPFYLQPETYWTVVHYARRYKEWAQKLSYGLSGVSYDGMPGKSLPGDPTAVRAAKNEALRGRMKLVEECAREAGPEIYEWLLIGVTTPGGISPDALRARGMPCGKKYYCKRRSRFYSLLAERI